ncbi:MAG: hypothetical protein DMF89_20975 [Acidobacteria bacterium]|nr:MAG: hypothetical protein DMF89_20975 [Acidobacteriota bacterium]
MFKHVSAISLLISWFLAVAVIVAWSVAVDAKLATSALLFVVGAAPAIVTMLIGLGGPSMTVAEILHSVHSEDGRGDESANHQNPRIHRGSQRG